MAKSSLDGQKLTCPAVILRAKADGSTRNCGSFFLPAFDRVCRAGLRKTIQTANHANPECFRGWRVLRLRVRILHQTHFPQYCRFSHFKEQALASARSTIAQFCGKSINSRHRVRNRISINLQGPEAERPIGAKSCQKLGLTLA
jgi:hypothetical protein